MGIVTLKAAVGENHTVVLKSDGTVWATGSNQYGQPGVDEKKISSNKITTFIQCVDSNGQAIEDAKDVAGGYIYTAIIRGANKEVW